MQPFTGQFVMMPAEEYERLSFLERKIDSILAAVTSCAAAPARRLPEDVDPENMSVAEAAVYTGMSVGFLNKCRWKDSTTKGPDYRKQGSKIVYSQADLDRWKQEQKVSGRKHSPSPLVRRFNRKRGEV